MNKIYGLVCPKSGEIRYIGKTKRDLQKRLQAHFAESKKRHSHKQRWIAACLDCGLIPSILLLEAVADTDSWQEREREWIQRTIASGVELTNQTAGGEGLDYLDKEAEALYRSNHSTAMKNWAASDSGRSAILKMLEASHLDAANENRRQSIIRAWQRPEAKQNLAEAMEKVRARPSFKAAKSKGAKQAWANHRLAIMEAFAKPEVKAKHSKRAKRCWSDPATRNRMMNRWTPEARALQSQGIRERQALIQSKMTPEVRAKQGATLKATWAKRKATT